MEAVQDKSICVSDEAVAVRLVGTDGGKVVRPVVVREVVNVDCWAKTEDKGETAKQKIRKPKTIFLKILLSSIALLFVL